MAKKFLVDIDLDGNVLLNPVLNPLATAPINAAQYYIYTSTASADNGTIYINIGTYASPSWLAIGTVISVNGQTGVVIITQDDVGDGITYVRTHNDLTDALKALINGALQQTGGTMSGNIDMDANKITGLGAPTNGTDAATKDYCDTVADGIIPPQTGEASTVLSTTGSTLEWRAPFVPYAQVDDTSTATAYTATVPGITELKGGVWMLLKNGVVTSAAGFTINVNGLGAKQVFNNMAAATAETTLFNINYTMLFIYDETRVEGGGWILYRGYNANDNTIGYQLRTNSTSLPMAGKTYRYRILFTAPDGEHWIPANTSTSTNATAIRDVIQMPINPFGEIVYYGTTAAVDVDSRPAVATLWQQYVLTLGYSFNRTGAALTLTEWEPVYIKCAPQSDGTAIIDATTPYVQALPTTEDGKIYIFLGIASSPTAVEMRMKHPIYCYKNGAVRLWTDTDSILPAVSSADNDKFLRVVNGAWAAVTVPIYNGATS